MLCKHSLFVNRASFDCRRHMGTEQFGFLVENSAITKDMLSPFTLSEMKKAALLSTSDEAEAAKIVEKYLRLLPKTKRLHMRNEHSRWVTVTLDHARFLKSIGVKIEKVAHAVLFASLSSESQRVHPYRTRIERMLRMREDQQRDIARLKTLMFPTMEQLRLMSFKKTLAFLTKIR